MNNNFDKEALFLAKAEYIKKTENLTDADKIAKRIGEIDKTEGWFFGRNIAEIDKKEKVFDAVPGSYKVQGYYFDPKTKEIEKLSMSINQWLLINSSKKMTGRRRDKNTTSQIINIAETLTEFKMMYKVRQQEAVAFVKAYNYIYQQEKENAMKIMQEAIKAPKSTKSAEAIITQWMKNSKEYSTNKEKSTMNNTQYLKEMNIVKTGNRIPPGATKCPICGSTHIQNVSRITGYLSLDERFGEGKVAERNDRVAHNNEQHCQMYKKDNGKTR